MNGLTEGPAMHHASQSTLNEIENGLLEDARATARRGKEESLGDKEWTKDLISRIAERGKSLKYGICAAGHENDGRAGWLYDLTWLQREDGTTNLLRQDGTPNPITAVPLILESELNPRPNFQQEDFEKLLISRAQFRVMVFQDSTAQRLTTTLRRLVQLAASSPLTQLRDRYLFLGYSWEEYDFVVNEAWVFEL